MRGWPVNFGGFKQRVRPNVGNGERLAQTSTPSPPEQVVDLRPSPESL